MSLADNVHVLTSEHMTLADTGEYIKAPPLLAQLRAACTSTIAVGRGSGGGGMVVNSKADKLEKVIKEAALYEHFEMAGAEYRGSIVGLLRTWPLINIDDYQEYLEHVTMDWIDSIRQLLEARRPPWKPSLPCPACSQRFYGPERDPCLEVHYWDHDAETMAHPSQWIAKCSGCGAEWNGDNLRWLRAASDTPEKVVAQVS